MKRAIRNAICAATICCSIAGASTATAQQQDPQRKQQACACKAAYQELNNPSTPVQRQLYLNKWVFDNCRLKNIGAEECR